MKIRTKLSIVILFILLFCSAVFYFLSLYSNYHFYEQKITATVDDTEKEFYHFLKRDVYMLSAALDVFLQGRCDGAGCYEDVFAERNRARLYELSLPLFEQLKTRYGITHFYYHLPDGYNFLRVHNRDIYGDKIDRFTFKQAEDTRESGAGLELGKTTFALRVVKPYYDHNQLLGYVEFGQGIDHFLTDIKAKTNNEFAILARKDYLNHDDWQSVRSVAGLRDNWDDFADYLIIDSTVGENPVLQNIYRSCWGDSKEGNLISRVYSSENRNFLCGGFPLYDAGGRNAGYISILNDVTEDAGFLTSFDGLLLIAFLLLIAAAYFICYFFINFIVTKPIDKFRRGTDVIAKGDLNYKLGINTRDEIGGLARSFNDMTRAIKNSRMDVDRKVAEQTKVMREHQKESEKARIRAEELNQAMIDRELKMMELQKENENLKQQLSNLSFYSNS